MTERANLEAQAARIAELEATLIKVDRAAYQTGFKAGQKSQAARIAELEAALLRLMTPQTPAAFADAMRLARAALGEKE